MGSRLNEIVIDCRDPRRLAEFWCRVLDYEILDENEEEVEINARQVSREEFLAGPISPSLLFERVPEGKTVKNRIHLDVSPINVDQQDEVDRLIGLGARHVDIGQGQQSWVVLADPEGNEFCVLRSVWDEQ
jgi:hypothetical protein